MNDLFVSYHRADQQWAEWIAGQLQDGGFTVVLEAWDFRPGSNLVLEIERAVQEARRVLVVLSPDYLLGELTQAQWAAAFAQDPSGQRGLLVPVYVRPCSPGGLLGQLSAIDLVGLAEEAARGRLLGGLSTDPAQRPRSRAFPGLRLLQERPAFPGDPAALLHRLPLPLAQLLRRALNGKSAIERHHSAYYLAEAALQLGASLRVGVWLQRCLDPASPLGRQLEALVLPTPGHWLDVLRAVDLDLAARPDAALLPLGAQLGRLRQPAAEWAAVLRLAQAARDEGTISDEAAQAVSAEGLLGFFELVVAYRGEVMGTPRRPPYHDRFSRLLLDALREVLGSPVLFGGLRLLCPRLRLEEGRQEVGWTWQDLTGQASMPLSDPPGALPEQVTPGQLFFVGPGAAVGLHPLAVYQENELDQEAVGLLHTTHRRTRQVGGAIEEVLRADYLDYASGQNLPGVDAGAALLALLGRLRGRAATPEALQQAQEASRAARHAEPPEEVVAAGAALGDFELQQEIGRGGMGIVFRARQRSLGRIVALKVLPPAQASDPVLVARFRREITALARCEHPNVVKILASGVDGDRYYYAMEYVEGSDLGRAAKLLSRWRSGGAELREGHLAAAISGSGPRKEAAPAADAAPAAAPEAAEQVPALAGGRELYYRLAEPLADAAMGLQHLHDRGILHRDIKPSNLMLTADGGRVVVMDLGLARLSDASRDLTKGQGEVLGTLRYMAPEQLEGKQPVDARADIYALGATLYEVTTGRPIFDGETETRLRQQILLEAPLPPRRAARRLPRDLATIITVATAKDPALRYPSAGAMAADLRAFSESRPIAAAPPSPFRALLLLARRQRAATVTLAAALLVALAAGGAWWDWTRVKVSYFANYATRWEVMEGVGEVSSRVQRRRQLTLRIHRQRGRVIRLERVNGSGALVNDEEGLASWEFAYRENGMLSERVARDRLGTVQLIERYSADLRRTERKDRSDKPKPMRGTDVTVILREFDARGHVRHVRFTDADEVARVGPNKAFAYEASCEERGLLASWRSVDPKGEPSLTAEGLASATMRHDHMGNLIETVLSGADGKPAPAKDGIASWRSRYDEWGNEIESAFFGVDGKQLTLNKDGIAIWRRRYDERGNVIETALFGVDGKSRTLHKDGYAIARQTYDERGNGIETALFGVDEKKRTLHRDGYAGWRKKYDGRGNELEIELFGVDEKERTLHKDGYAIVRQKYDERGNVIESAFFGVDEKKRTLHKDGYAIARRKYDVRDNEIETELFGVDGKERTLHKEGFAILRKTYDKRGNEVETELFGVDEKKRTLHKEGFAVSRKTYDERGNVIESAFFGVDEKKRTLHEDGYAILRKKYDERGNVIESSYFDVDEELIVRKDGVAIWSRKYDERGNEIEASFFGVDRKPTLHEFGYAVENRKYDERGNEIEASYFGVNGNPVLHKDGYARWNRKYDERGNEIEASYFGVNGNPVLHKDGYARWNRKYDERGNEIEASFFGVNGNPVLHKDGYANWRIKYDERGNEIEIAYFGVNGNPVLHKNGYARWNRKYDERGNEIEASYFGVNGSPVLHKDGYASWSRKFNERGDEIECSVFDVRGEPTLRVDGVATLRQKHDGRGNVIEDSSFGVRGEPTLRDDGSAILRRKFDERGNVIEVSCFDVRGERTLCKDGAATLRQKYDGRGNVTEVSSFDVRGEPTLRKDGAATLRQKYDGRGNQIEVAYFGVKGEPVRNDKGHAGCVTAYQPPSQALWSVCYDLRGAPLEGVVAGTRWHLKGKQLMLTDTEDRPVQDPALVAGLTRTVTLIHARYRLERLRATRPGLFRDARGVLIAEVKPGGQAQRLGLAVGDLLVESAGHPVNRMEDGPEGVARLAGAAARVVVVRQEDNVTVEAGPGALGVVLSPL